MKIKKGFTIIELIVVMAIIGILVLLAMPKFMGHTKQAKFTKFISNAKQIENASERYYMDKNDWPRLTDVPYTSAQITAFSQKIYDATGKEATLDATGNYYDIDYSKLSQYVKVADDNMDYVIQNPVGNVYALQNLTQVAQVRTSNINVTGIELNKNTATINVGATLQLTTNISPINATNKDVVWTSNNTSVATVNSLGVVTAITNGTAIITGKTVSGNYTANCTTTINLVASSVTFTNAGVRGNLGPTQAQLNATYVGTPLSGVVFSINGIQKWVVSQSGTYRIQTYGAGGTGNNTLGKGAVMVGDFNLLASDVLFISVGQQGGQYLYGTGSGGTFVTKASSIGGTYVTATPLIIAGGAGSSSNNMGLAIPDASITTTGNRGYDTLGGTNGQGGVPASNTWWGGSGAGFLTNGGTSRSDGYAENVAYSFMTGSIGGFSGRTGNSTGLEAGGFGGGGASGGAGGAGGGGYSGGGAGNADYSSGGGGGSYNIGANQSNSVGNTSNGKVIITQISYN